MNIKKTIALATLACTMFVGCKQTSNEQNEETKSDSIVVAEKSVASNEVVGKIEKASFEIEGMSCAVGCAKIIEGRLAKLDGVKSATVDFETKSANVEFDNGKQNQKSIQETVEKIADGIYKVEKMSSSLETAMLVE